MKYLRSAVLIIIMAIVMSEDNSCCSSSTSSSADNQPPYGTTVYPRGGMEDISLTPPFIWSVHDDGSFIRYDLSYWKADDESQVWSYEGLADTIFTPAEDLEEDTWYKWELVARDREKSRTITGSEPLDFKTGADYNGPPFRVEYIYPVTCSGVPIDTLFYWDCSDPDGDDLSYDLTCWKSSSVDTFFASDVTDEFLVVPTLDPNTRYFWSVKAKDPMGQCYLGLNASFSTIITEPPGTPYILYPPSGSSGVVAGVELSWGCDHPASMPMVYHLYLGKVSDGEPVVVSEGQSGTTYSPSPMLENDTQYAWRIVASDGYNETSSPTWTFTTESFGGEGVFAILTARRTVMYNSPEIIRIDALTARFDAEYAPDDPITSLTPDSVAVEGEFNSFVLSWQSSGSLYSYTNFMSGHFLVPGFSYTFKIFEGDGVPNMIKDFDFIDCEVYITSPAQFSYLSLDGFEMTWNSTCSGMIDIIVRDTFGDDTGVSIQTQDDGSYTFTSEDLSSLPESTYEFYVVLIKKVVEPINAAGYDQRSWIETRVEGSALYNKQ